MTKMMKMTDIEIEEFRENFNKKLILLCESGSGTYGFKSETSDTDIRGVFIEDNSLVLGLRKPRNTIEGFSPDRMVDWQIFELEKFLRLLIKPNFNIMEWVYTPYQYVDYPPIFMEIADLSLSQILGNHVRGWAYSIYKMNWNDPKKCIYAIRPLMVYINLCETGEFESDITKISNRFDLTDHVDTLIDLYRGNRKVSDMMRATNLRIYDDLVEESRKVEKDSLPERPRPGAFEKANEFLIMMRSI